MSLSPTSDISCSRATAAVRAGIDRDTAYGAVTPPIVLSSNFSFDGFGNKRQYDYTRSGNPTRDLLGEALAELEGGAGGVITATGMGAINLVLNALLEPGERLVVPHDAYGGSWRLFNALAKKGHFELITADLTDPRSLADALAQSPKLVLIETPSNPLLRVTDLRFVIDAAHKAGAKVVVDNTFLSPALQTPIAFGADVVLHSTTKYVNGHSDVVGGAVIAREDVSIPVTQLFLTGGDTTVRGYSYQSIGARTDNGLVTGGRYMASGSVEWQRPITVRGNTSDWESTLFLDAGTVTDNTDALTVRAGVGTGIRWRSPVGPVQADLAYGIQSKSLRLHLRLGFTF